MENAFYKLNSDQYRQLPLRDRASALRKLWKQIFGFEIGFVVGVRVARYTEPRHDPKWSPLLAGLLRAEDDVRLASDIARSFARIQAGDGLPTLSFAMDSTHHKVRWWGAWGAGAIAASGAVPQLIELLNDARVQDAAAGALREIGDQQGLEPLKEAAARASGDAAELLELRAKQLARKLDRARAGSA
jgi:HEAT repeat protein